MALAQIRLPDGNRFPSLTKGSVVYHSIRRSILLREINAGDPLTEQLIGSEFNCSQGTVREALMRLQEEGLVQRRGYRGTSVSHSSLAEVVQMAEIRIKLETEAVAHSVPNLKDANIIEFENCLSEMETAFENKDAYALSELDRSFHLALYRCANFPNLEPILTRCMLHMHLQTFANSHAKFSSDPPTRAHMKILKALRKRNSEKAADAIKNHVMDIISRWSPSLKSALDLR